MMKNKKKNHPFPSSHSYIPFIILSLLSALFPSSFSLSSPPNDTAALTHFRLHSDLHGNLLSNWTGSDACSHSWHGVGCSSDSRVIALSLPSSYLRGPISSLSSLDQLRRLDLRDNRLNGSISPLTNCTNLKLLYLAGNEFSGEIPSRISSLRRLLRLDLSNNNIHGEIPNELSRLTRLLTLRLQNNVISGLIPDLSVSLVNLGELNLTNNELYGKLPEGLLKKFGEKSFTGNEGLCGSNPLPNCSYTGIPSPTGSSSSSSSSPQSIVPSNPSSLPKSPIIGQLSNKQSRKTLSRGAVVAIVVANCVALLVIVSFTIAYYCARDRSSSSSMGAESERGKRRSSVSSYGGGEKKFYANGGGENDGTEKGKLVFMDWKKQFELEDLLRASAEMLGKGSLGTVYRAVLDDGCTVAVKRLKDANPCSRKEFEGYMDVIGNMKHANAVRLRAYYYAKEEKLLVYDYLPNGSLHSLLHGRYIVRKPLVCFSSLKQYSLVFKYFNFFYQINI